MPKDTEEGCPTAEMQRQLEAERHRLDWLLHLLTHHGSALARIEQRCTQIEERLSSALTPTQWAKILVGLALPLAVLILTGNADLARRFMLAP